MGIPGHIGIVPLRVVLIDLTDTRLLLANAIEITDIGERNLLNLHIVVVVLESTAFVRNRCGDHDLIRVDGHFRGYGLCGCLGKCV